MVSEAELAELREQAKQFKVIPGEWPANRQCLRIAVAHVLRVPVEWVPARRYEVPVNEWLADVSLKFDVFFRLELRENLPPPDYVRWIAFMPGDDADHALPMAGRRPLREPFRYADPVAECTGGFVLEPLDESVEL